MATKCHLTTIFTKSKNSQKVVKDIKNILDNNIVDFYLKNYNKDKKKTRKFFCFFSLINHPHRPKIGGPYE